MTFAELQTTLRPLAHEACADCQQRKAAWNKTTAMASRRYSLKGPDSSCVVVLAVNAFRTERPADDKEFEDLDYLIRLVEYNERVGIDVGDLALGWLGPAEFRALAEIRHVLQEYEDGARNELPPSGCWSTVRPR